ncbi:unnamed protein product [Angiostrongylus costaricensis]|uniref:SAWADEE domain-containing protein n=1 Tax=Angiostrongylus costaricensis TaxID=334426 RepID=A0A0R3PTJ3_ANGCS|nr:unnamed protein product [Angiostrongylus costaricensis]
MKWGGVCTVWAWKVLEWRSIDALSDRELHTYDCHHYVFIRQYDGDCGEEIDMLLYGLKTAFMKRPPTEDYECTPVCEKESHFAAKPQLYRLSRNLAIFTHEGSRNGYSQPNHFVEQTEDDFEKVSGSEQDLREEWENAKIYYFVVEKVMEFDSLPFIWLRKLVIASRGCLHTIKGNTFHA